MLKKMLLVVCVVGLLCSGGFLFHQYRTVDRWQQRGLENYHVENKQSPIHGPTKIPIPEVSKPKVPCPAWLEQSPVSIALGLWITMLANIVTLGMSFLSATFMYVSYKKSQTKVIEEKK